MTAYPQTSQPATPSVRKGERRKGVSTCCFSHYSIFKVEVAQEEMLGRTRCSSSTI